MSADQQVKNKLSEAVNKILLKDIMKYPPIVLEEDEEFHMVEKTLRESEIKHLPIVNYSGQLVGLITLSDLYRTCSPRKKMETGNVYFYTKEQLDQYVLRHVMTKDPFTLRADNTLLEAMQNMVVGKFGCVPVVDSSKKIVGIITQTDIIKVITSLISSKKV